MPGTRVMGVTVTAFPAAISPDDRAATARAGLPVRRCGKGVLRHLADPLSCRFTVRDLGWMAHSGLDREHRSLYSEQCLHRMNVVHRTDLPGSGQRKLWPVETSGFAAGHMTACRRSTLRAVTAVADVKQAGLGPRPAATGRGGTGVAIKRTGNKAAERQADHGEQPERWKKALPAFKSLRPST